MSRVTVETTVRAPIAEVWDRVSDYPAYRRFMASVEEVTELPERNGNRITSWRVRLKGSMLHWTDETIARPDEWRLDFFQVDGDLERFDGYWQLQELEPSLTGVSLGVDFEIGIPQLRTLLNAAAAAAIRENSLQMLKDLDLELAGAND